MILKPYTFEQVYLLPNKYFYDLWLPSYRKSVIQQWLATSALWSYILSSFILLQGHGFEA